MNPNDPTTLRWLITQKWGDAASHSQALQIIDRIVGFPAPGKNSTTSPVVTAPSGAGDGAGSIDASLAPNVTGGGVATPGRKVALVIGHNSVAKGAWADAPVSAFEYDFNNAVVSEMLSPGLARKGIECRRFLRTTGGGYNTEIDRVYRAVNEYKPDLCVELHFNGGGGDYATMLHERGNDDGAMAARAMLDMFASRLGIRAWGLMPRSISDRGGRSVVRSNAPCVLTEPFFGDHPQHLKRVNEHGVRGVAGIYLDAIADALKSIGKPA
jgi:hypothetical protein